MAKMLDRLDSLAGRLKAACDNLGNSGPSAAANASQSLNRPDQNLVEISRDVAALAQKLQSGVAELTPPGRRSKRKALGQSVKILWRKGSIDEIQQKLEKHEKVMHTLLLTDLR